MQPYHQSLERKACYYDEVTCRRGFRTSQGANYQEMYTVIKDVDLVASKQAANNSQQSVISQRVASVSKSQFQPVVGPTSLNPSVSRQSNTQTISGQNNEASSSQTKSYGSIIYGQGLNQHQAPVFPTILVTASASRPHLSLTRQSSGLKVISFDEILNNPKIRYSKSVELPLVTNNINNWANKALGKFSDGFYFICRGTEKNTVVLVYKKDGAVNQKNVQLIFDENNGQVCFVCRDDNGEMIGYADLGLKYRVTESQLIKKYVDDVSLSLFLKNLSSSSLFSFEEIQNHPFLRNIAGFELPLVNNNDRYWADETLFKYFEPGSFFLRESALHGTLVCVYIDPKTEEGKRILIQLSYNSKTETLNVSCDNEQMAFKEFLKKLNPPHGYALPASELALFQAYMKSILPKPKILDYLSTKRAASIVEHRCKTACLPLTESEAVDHFTSKAFDKSCYSIATGNQQHIFLIRASANNYCEFGVFPTTMISELGFCKGSDGNIYVGYSSTQDTSDYKHIDLFFMRFGSPYQLAQQDAGSSISTPKPQPAAGSSEMVTSQQLYIIDSQVSDSTTRESALVALSFDDIQNTLSIRNVLGFELPLVTDNDMDGADNILRKHFQPGSFFIRKSASAPKAIEYVFINSNQELECIKIKLSFNSQDNLVYIQLFEGSSIFKCTLHYFVAERTPNKTKGTFLPVYEKDLLLANHESRAVKSGSITPKAPSQRLTSQNVIQEPLSFEEIQGTPFIRNILGFELPLVTSNKDDWADNTLEKFQPGSFFLRKSDSTPDALVYVYIKPDNQIGRFKIKLSFNPQEKLVYVQPFEASPLYKCTLQYFVNQYTLNTTRGACLPVSESMLLSASNKK